MDERLLEIEKLFKQKMKLTKGMKWQLRDNQELKELSVALLNLIDEMNQDYYVLANLADGFVDLMPCHKLYESCRQDLKRCIKKIKGL